MSRLYFNFCYGWLGVGGWVAGSNGNKANSASIVVESEIESKWQKMKIKNFLGREIILVQNNFGSKKYFGEAFRHLSNTSWNNYRQKPGEGCYFCGREENKVNAFSGVKSASSEWSLSKLLELICAGTLSSQGSSSSSSHCW